MFLKIALASWRLGVLAPRGVDRRARPSEEVISRLVLLKNSDTLERQTLAENQKLNYAFLMSNLGCPHRFVRFAELRTP
jgi:hypothetical protein